MWRGFGMCDWFRRLADEGWFKRLHYALLMTVREHHGREASPTLETIDSQTVKVMAPAGPRGYDAAKKTNGRRRHILVDSLGNLLAVHVTDGAVQDRDGGVTLVGHVVRSSLGSSALPPIAPMWGVLRRR